MDLLYTPYSFAFGDATVSKVNFLKNNIFNLMRIFLSLFRSVNNTFCTSLEFMEI